MASDVNSSNVTGVTFDGATMTEVLEGTDNIAVDSIYVLPLGTAVGSTTGDIVVTSGGGASAEKFIAAVVFENVDQADPTSSEVKRLDSSGASSSTLAVASVDGDLVFDMIDTYQADAPSTLTVGVDQTQLHDQSGSSFSGGFAHYSTSTKDGAAGATTSWSTNAIALQHMAMNIKAAPLSGSLTIVKEAAVEDGTDFAFTSDIPGGSSFTLDVDNDNTYTDTITFADIPVGSYAITETVPAGWSIRFANCTGGSDSGSLTDDTLTVALGADEDITCIFNNSINTNIIINKDVLSGGADEDIDFEFFFNSSIGGYLGTFFLSETESNTPSRTDGVFEDLPTPLLFTVEEEDLPANWALQDIKCTSSNGSTNITKLLDQDKVELRIPASGDDIECTFINALSGSLTIIKEAAIEDGTDFAFTSDIPGGSSFTLDDEASQTDAINQSITFPDIAVGSYAITETLPASWQLDSANCTGGADSGSLSGKTLTVVLGVGEDITCTFSNSLQPGTILIEKITLPAGGTSFGYVQTIRSPFSFLLDDGDTETFTNVPAGTYYVAEQDHFPHVLTNLVCDDGASAVPSETYIGGNTPFDCFDEPAANACDNVAIINLEPGETIHCTYTNVIPSSIRMQKIVPPGEGDPSNPDQAFTLNFTNFDDVNAGNSTFTDGSGFSSFSGLLPDTYTVRELDLPAGWTLDDLSCTSEEGTSTIGTFTPGDTSLEVDLAAGDGVQCSFTNSYDDGDGVEPTQEDGVPGYDGSAQGDGNGDGIADKQQATVSSVQNGSCWWTLASDGQQHSEVQTAAVPADVSSLLAYPCGFLDFDAELA
ncbi:MAG: hypothetical protein KDK05_07385, partial [Candidatus Competibacteraceae bacterium]|nr:hypothetical protein [Candidatus Competibacteraceae bacterium]